MNIGKRLGVFLGTDSSRQAQPEVVDSVLSGTAADVDASVKREFQAREAVETSLALTHATLGDVMREVHSSKPFVDNPSSVDSAPKDSD